MPRRGPGEGSIYTRKDGRWTASCRIAGKREYFYGHTRREVSDALADALHAAKTGAPARISREPLATYLASWLETTAKPRVRPGTARTYQDYVGHLSRLAGHIRLCDFTSDHIQIVYHRLATQLAPGTIGNVHKLLTRALKDAAARNLIPRNPAAYARPPRVPRAEIATLTASEVDRLLTTTAGTPLYPLWAILTTTGLRLGEALGLTWPDLTAGTLQVRRTLTYTPGRGTELTEPKTATSRRTVHLTQTAIDALRDHRAQQLATQPWTKDGLIFRSPAGRPLCHVTVRIRLRAATDAAGLPPITPKQLRHTVATLLLQANVHPKIVAELLGHASITTTMDVYSHVLPSSHAAAAAVLDTLLTPTPRDAGAEGLV